MSDTRFTPLQPATGKPVVPGLEPFETVYAKDQPPYQGLKVLKSMKNSGAVLSRWQLTPAQRLQVLNGADIFLEVLTFHRPIQPVMLHVGVPGEKYFTKHYGLESPDVLEPEGEVQEMLPADEHKGEDQGETK